MKRAWLAALACLAALASAQPKPRQLVVGEGLPVKLSEQPRTASDLLRIEKKGKEWWLTGLKPGSAEMELGKSRVLVEVLPLAARLPAPPRVTLFGEFPKWKALEQWVRPFVQAGAVLSRSGETLSISGPNLFPVQLSSKAVQWETLPFAPPVAEQLLLSNWPERVEEDQTLFEAPLPAGPARVMLHHRNMPGQPLRWLDVELLAGAEPQKLAVVSHVVGPSTDEIFAGHLAASRYLDALSGPVASGWVQELPAGSVHRLEHLVFKPGQTISGMLLLTPLPGSGPGGKIRVVARSSEEETAAPALHPIEPGARTARGVFPPVQSKTLEYRVGPAYLYEDLGAAPYTTSLDGGVPNAGNFGVVFRYNLVLRNEGTEDKEVRLALSARGGPARGTFFVDGERVETGLLAAEPRILKRWVVAAGSVLQARLETFPQAGSNYPVHLVFSSGAASAAGGSAPAADAEWRIP